MRQVMILLACSLPATVSAQQICTDLNRDGICDQTGRSLYSPAEALNTFGLGAPVSVSPPSEMFGLDVCKPRAMSPAAIPAGVEVAPAPAGAVVVKRSVQVSGRVGPIRRVLRRVLFWRKGLRRVRSSNWTWPGGSASSLRSHLSGWPHNVNASSWSFERMRSYHNEHHNRIGPVSAAQLAINNRR